MTNTMAEPVHNLKGSVFLVDDDVAVRRGVKALLTAADYDVVSYKSGDEFLEALPTMDVSGGAVIVDVCMPGIQGLELQERLKQDNVPLPVIVMTAHGDIPMAVKAMRNGAVDFLEKPFTVDEITTALDRAFSLPRSSRPRHSASSTLIARFESLTPREKEVLHEIVEGATNKEIARTLELSPRTVEVHRQRIMQKMQAKSFAMLVRMAVALNAQLEL